MIVQNQIVNPTPLLNDKGELIQKGYSTQAVLTYNREQIKAAPWRVKEWDFYQVNNDDYCLQMTVGHVGYAGNVNVKLFEFATGIHYEISDILAFPFSSLNLPRSAEEGNVSFRGKHLTIDFELFEGGRRLKCKGIKKGHPSIDVDVTLAQPDKASIVLATPFKEKKTQFYYNHKINMMPATGTVKIGNNDKVYTFAERDSFGLLDWGRGVWPFSHEWVWGSGASYVNGKRFGFNIGFGFGDTSQATENIVFYDGRAHKLTDVHIDLFENGLMTPKKITSSDGRFEMEFIPIYDQKTATKLLFVNNKCNQIFARFKGKVVLDDGSVLNIEHCTGFVEHAFNNW